MRILKGLLNVGTAASFLAFLALTFVGNTRFQVTAPVLFLGTFLLGTRFTVQYLAKPLAKRKERLLLAGLFASLLSIAFFVVWAAADHR
jgi:hypothetical protein